MTVEEQPDAAAARLREAQFVVALTGAGISADSGLGTYRTGDTALWSDANMERYAHPGGFKRHSAEAWAWYDARRRAMLAAEPNEGHRALARLERHVPRMLLLTQNIDGLHQRAGSTAAIELHEASIERAFAEAARCDLMLTVGTSNQVQPAASIPWKAADKGRPVIVINPDMTGQRRGRTITHLEGEAAAILPALVARAWPAGD